MFARPIQVAIAVAIAIVSVASAAYATDVSLVTTSPDPVVTTSTDQNGEPFATHRLVLAFTPVVQTQVSMASADLRTGIATKALPTSVISELDIVLARTASGARLVAAKLNGIKYSWNEKQMSCLVTLWVRESHWNFKSRNSRSGAYGIPQANPGSKMASVGSDWRTNPITQIKWGMGYVKSRYGTPCSALAKSNRSGWY